MSLCSCDDLLSWCPPHCLPQPCCSPRHEHLQALFQPETELLALEVLGAIAEQIARSDAAAHRANNEAGLEAAGNGADLFSCLTLADGLLLGGASNGAFAAPLEAILGHLEAGTAISLGAALPWLCVHLREVGHEAVVESYLESTADACAALGWGDLAAALGALSGMAGTAEEPEQWLPPLCTVRRACCPGLSRARPCQRTAAVPWAFPVARRHRIKFLCSPGPGLPAGPLLRPVPGLLPPGAAAAHGNRGARGRALPGSRHCLHARHFPGELGVEPACHEGADTGCQCLAALVPVCAEGWRVCPSSGRTSHLSNTVLWCQAGGASRCLFLRTV